MIVETGDREFAFVLSVVRGPTYHSGMIDGVARVNESLARFTIREEDFDEETWITFRNVDGPLQVFGANTHFYHGMRAYFDGTYIRIREMTDEDRNTFEEFRN